MLYAALPCVLVSSMATEQHTSPLCTHLLQPVIGVCQQGRGQPVGVVHAVVQQQV
jgi:hypothetical protein